MLNKEIRETSRFSAEDKGKKIDFTRMCAKECEGQKPIERLEPASDSTREKSRLLGGTPEAARKYIDDLKKEEPEKYKAYLAYRRYRREYGREKAKKEYKEGYSIELQYGRIYGSIYRYRYKVLSRPTTGQLRLNEKDQAKYPGTSEERQKKYWSQYE